MAYTQSPRTESGPAPEQGQGAAQDAKDRAQDAAGTAKDQAQQTAQQAKGQIRDQVDQRSTQAGEQVLTTTEAIRQASSSLRDKGQDGPARFVDQAADRLESAGSWLKDSDGDRILSDAEDFGRRNTWAVVAGGVAIGVVLSRVLKASSSERYESRGAARSRDRSLPATTTPRQSIGAAGTGTVGSSFGTTGTGPGRTASLGGEGEGFVPPQTSPRPAGERS